MVSFNPITRLLLCYIVLPVLKKLYDILEIKTSGSETQWDDLAASILGGIVGFLEVLCYDEEKNDRY